MRRARRTKRKPSPRWALFGALVVLIVVAVAYYSANFEYVGTENSPTGDEYVLPNEPIHWHPELRIFVDGEEVAIPANIGIGTNYSDFRYYNPVMRMAEIHTHDFTGVLHWEILDRPPRAEEMRLGNFFDVWGEAFNSTCLMDMCAGAGDRIYMTVNGEENADFEGYMVRDGDLIEIFFDRVTETV